MCCCFAEFITKYVLFFANFVFCLAGLALIGVGVAVLVQTSDLEEVFPAGFSGIPIAVIVLGSIIFAIAFFGCCGAIRESKCLLIMYFICVGILAAGKIYLTTVIFNGLSDLQSTVAKWVNQAFKEIKVAAVVETAFECCGTTGPEWYTGDLPASCCGLPQGNTCPAVDAYRGCIPRINDYLATYGEAVGSVLIVIIVVELVAVVFSLFLCCSVSRKQRV